MQLKVLFTLAIYTGLRKGEILALTWEGIDLENNTVSAILGHRETSTTTDIYSHSLQTAEQEAANKIEQLLTKQA